MHPVEHTIYFSCALLPLVFTLHPLCFLFNLLHAAISPMAGHDGLSGEHPPRLAHLAQIDSVAFRILEECWCGLQERLAAVGSGTICTTPTTR